MNKTPIEIEIAATQLADVLRQADFRIVFAESCTGGLVAATLAAVPGISAWLCGSAVTYREQTKVEWLGVSAELIERYSAVSDQVTTAMARQVLARTPEADLAAAITGHLGPDAPAELDGQIFIAIAKRSVDGPVLHTRRTTLENKDRAGRQQEAACALLVEAAKVTAPTS